MQNPQNQIDLQEMNEDFPDTFFQNTRKTLDPIHSYIRFDNDIWKFIDTPIFQRLRDIRQLGGVSYVFYGGCHSRFEHSLGVGHLAKKQIKKIFKHQSSLGEIFGSGEDVERIIKNVTLAGVLHDVGHGPHSHMFDHKVIPTLMYSVLRLSHLRPGTKWKHERGSSLLVEKIVDDYNIDIEKEDVEMIKDLITSNVAPKYNEYSWIFEIVANNETSVDVDKFDYVSRDTHHIGAKDTLSDYRLLLREARVIDNHICYPAKASHSLAELFYARFKLFKYIYYNRSSCAAELMIAEILINANPKYKFDEIIQFEDMDRYIKLTDHIIREIEYSDDPSLKKSQELILRLRRRDIYKFVAETVSLTYDQKLDDIEKIKEDICSHAVNDGLISLKSENIELINVVVDYGRKFENPLSKVRYYNKNNISKSFTMEPSQLSTILPKNCFDKTLRLYAKEQKYAKIAADAFRKYCKERNIEVSKFESKHPYDPNNFAENREIQKKNNLRD